MLEVRDFGFATYLFMQGIPFEIESNIASFKLSPEDFDKSLIRYRESSFYQFDKKAKELKKKIKKV